MSEEIPYDFTPPVVNHLPQWNDSEYADRIRIRLAASISAWKELSVTAIAAENKSVGEYIKQVENQRDAALAQLEAQKRETARKHEQVCVLQSQVDNHDVMLEQVRMNEQYRAKKELDQLRADLARVEGDAKPEWQPRTTQQSCNGSKQ